MVSWSPTNVCAPIYAAYMRFVNVWLTEALHMTFNDGHGINQQIARRAHKGS